MFLVLVIAFKNTTNHTKPIMVKTTENTSRISIPFVMAFRLNPSINATIAEIAKGIATKPASFFCFSVPDITDLIVSKIRTPAITVPSTYSILFASIIQAYIIILIHKPRNLGGRFLEVKTTTQQKLYYTSLKKLK